VGEGHLMAALTYGAKGFITSAASG